MIFLSAMLTAVAFSTRAGQEPVAAATAADPPRAVGGEPTHADPSARFAAPASPAGSILSELFGNIRRNLFKPLLLFFYLGFLIPLLKVEFEFPYPVYQGLTIYLLIAIGRHGGQELARLGSSTLGNALGFMAVGFAMNTIIGVVTYLTLGLITPLRRIDRATVAGYYGSDSAGTFVTCLGVLASAQIAYDAYMPVMLAVMEIPGCLVALTIVARLRATGMDPAGTMPDEPGHDPNAPAVLATSREGRGHEPKAQRTREADPDLSESAEMSALAEDERAKAVEIQRALALSKREYPTALGVSRPAGLLNPKLLHEVFLNPGLVLLFGGIVIGYIGGLQGPEVTRVDDDFFVKLFQGMLCLFLLEMGMTAARKLRDLRDTGVGFIVFGLVAPNIFATAGMIVAHLYSYATGAHLELGTYVLFAVLCGAASYIAVPAVQRLAIPEASPTLPLAASLGLTFTYNVTIGIPVYLQIARSLISSFAIA
jgi:hypothetical protein